MSNMTRFLSAREDILEILKVSNTFYMKRDEKYILFSIKEAFATQRITIGIARKLNKNEISLQARQITAMQNNLIQLTIEL